MHVLVTGAGGFVGRALVQRLLDDPAATPRPLTRLTAIDQRLAETPSPIPSPAPGRSAGPARRAAGG